MSPQPTPSPRPPPTLQPASLWFLFSIATPSLSQLCTSQNKQTTLPPAKGKRSRWHNDSANLNGCTSDTSEFAVLPNLCLPFSFPAKDTFVPNIHLYTSTSPLKSLWTTFLFYWNFFGPFFPPFSTIFKPISIRSLCFSTQSDPLSARIKLKLY